jgi:hypothetical protein
MHIPTQEEMKADYETLKANNPEKILAAIKFLSETLGDSFWKWLETAKAKEGHQWFVHDIWHFNGGMAVRNHLRENGFGEDYIGVDNLDDTYTFLVEDAYGIKLYNDTIK